MNPRRFSGGGGVVSGDGVGVGSLEVWQSGVCRVGGFGLGVCVVRGLFVGEVKDRRVIVGVTNSR